MPVEFLGIAATNDGSETTARSGPIFDKEYTAAARPGARGERLGPGHLPASFNLTLDTSSPLLPA